MGDVGLGDVPAVGDLRALVEVAKGVLPGGVEVLVGEEPDIAVELLDGVRVPEEGRELASAQGWGPIGEEALAQRREVLGLVAGMDARSAEERGVDCLGFGRDRNLKNPAGGQGRIVRLRVQVLEDLRD